MVWLGEEETVWEWLWVCVGIGVKVAEWEMEAGHVGSLTCSESKVFDIITNRLLCTFLCQITLVLHPCILSEVTFTLCRATSLLHSLLLGLPSNTQAMPFVNVNHREKKKHTQCPAQKGNKKG